ncbi:MAG: AraC family transcriptional regulator [Puniceicoccaceae bacterium]
MGYFDGITFDISGHEPRYHYEIDTVYTYYAINFIREGTFVFGAGEEEPQPVHNLPYVLITAPGRRFRYWPGESGNWDHAYVTFSGPRVEDWIEQGLLPGIGDSRYLLQPVNNEPAFTAAFQQILQATHASPVQYERAVHLLEGLLLLVMEDANPEEPTERVPMMHRQIAAINTDPEKPWDLEHLGQQAGYSKAHYRRLFAKLTGASPIRYIRERRMQKAAHLLRTTRTPIKAIAAACGYEDLFHFTKQFKQVHCRPPGQFRKEVTTSTL